jgi:hypothetical protein
LTEPTDTGGVNENETDHAEDIPYADVCGTDSVSVLVGQ